MSRKGFILNVVSVVVAVVFFWTNCVWAGTVQFTTNTLALHTQLVDLLKVVRAVYTGTSYHTGLIEEGITNLKMMREKLPYVRELAGKFHKSQTGKEEGDLYFKTLIFSDEEGGIAYYTFTPDGYFYRFTSKEHVNDPFYRLIERFSASRTEMVKVPVEGGDYYQQIIRISPEVVSLVNTCFEKLYSIIVVNGYFVVEKGTGRIIERLSTSGKRVLRESDVIGSLSYDDVNLLGKGRLSDEDMVRGINEGRFVVMTEQEVLDSLDRSSCGIGITGGGDCAGIADFIGTLKKHLDPGLTMLGVRYAGKGLSVSAEEFNKGLIIVDELAAKDFEGQSSTPYGSARIDPLKSAPRNAKANISGYRFFYGTGGNDHLGLLEKITEEFPDMIVVGTFKSIDGDGCVAGRPAQMLGFDSALKNYREAIWNIAQSAKTHEQWDVLETFGRGAGKLVYEAARRYPKDFDRLPAEERRKIIECRDTVMILVPEKPVTLKAVAEEAKQIKEREGSVVVVVAEGFMPPELQGEMDRLAKDKRLKGKWLAGELTAEEIPMLIEYKGDEDPKKDIAVILRDRRLAVQFAQAVWESKLDAFGNVANLSGIRHFIIQTLHKLAGAKKVNNCIQNYEARGASPSEYDSVMAQKIGRKIAGLINQGVTGGKAVVYFEGMDAMTEEPEVVDLVGVSDENNLNNSELYPEEVLQKNGVFWRELPSLPSEAGKSAGRADESRTGEGELDIRNLFASTIPPEDRFNEEDFSVLIDRMIEIKQQLEADIESAKTESGRRILIKNWREWLLPWLVEVKGDVKNILNYEYWLYNNPIINKIIGTAEEVRRDETRAFVHVGIGGSIIPTRAIVNPNISSTVNQMSPEARGGSPQVYYTGDSFSPELITELLEALEDQGILFKTKFNIISKSGTTAETIGTYLVIRARLQMRLQELLERYRSGEIDKKDLEGLGLSKEDITPVILDHKPYFKTGRYFIATTGFSRGSVLYSQFHHRGRESEELDSLRGDACYQGTDFDPFYAILPVPEGMGGRFSGFSAVGLLLLAVTANENLGETPRSRVKEAFNGIYQALLKILNTPVDSEDNVAFKTAAISHIAEYKKKKAIEVLYFFDPRLADAAKLLDELYSESLQEEGRGIDVRPLLGTVDNHMAWNGIIAGPRNKIIRFIMTENYDSVKNPLIPAGSGITGDIQAIEDLRFGDVQKQAALGTAEDATRPIGKKGELPGVLNYIQKLHSRTVVNVCELIFTMMLETAILGKLNGLEKEIKEDGTVVDLTYLQHWVEGYKEAMRERCKQLKIQRASGETQGSHVAKAIPDESREKLVSNMGLKKNGTLIVKQDSEEYIGRLKKVLDRLEHIYGLGLFIRVYRIQIVENLGAEGLYPQGRAPLASYKDGVLKVDRLLFDSGQWMLFEELEHELLESIGEIIPGSNEALADIVATYRNVLRFLNPNMEIPDDVYQEEILQVLQSPKNPIDPDGEYLKLLTGLRKLQQAGTITENEIIGSVAGYVMRTKLYEKVRDGLGLPSYVAEQIRDLDPGLDDALQIFNEIVKAKEGEELIEKVKEKSDLTLSVVKTFTGTVRIKGLKKLSKGMASLIAGSVKAASKKDMLHRGLKQYVADNPVDLKTQYCLVIDEMTREMQEEKERLEEFTLEDGRPLFVVAGSIQEAIDNGFKGKKIVHLSNITADYEELKRTEEKSRILYAPMPYLRSSLYVAASVALAEGNVRRLGQINPLALDLVKDLYGSYLDSFNETIMEQLFTEPWFILPGIQRMIEGLNNFHKTLKQIEKAA